MEFSPGWSSLVAQKIHGNGSDRFNIYRGVTIHEISEQPAGEHRGTTTVTIISPEGTCFSRLLAKEVVDGDRVEEMMVLVR